MYIVCMYIIHTLYTCIYIICIFLCTGVCVCVYVCQIKFPLNTHEVLSFYKHGNSSLEGVNALPKITQLPRSIQVVGTKTVSL